MAGLEDRIGLRPDRGWIRVIREALGMSTYDLGRRMGVTASRVCQLERAELDGRIRLCTLERVAASLNCNLFYVLVPNEPLEQIVLQQARRKATSEIIRLTANVDPRGKDWALVTEAMFEQVDVVAADLLDRRDLWWDPPRG
jgi:predicted DNA-binding mobile mystery protein A